MAARQYSCNEKINNTTCVVSLPIHVAGHLTWSDPDFVRCCVGGYPGRGPPPSFPMFELLHIPIGRCMRSVSRAVGVRNYRHDGQSPLIFITVLRLFVDQIVIWRVERVVLYYVPFLCFVFCVLRSFSFIF